MFPVWLVLEEGVRHSKLSYTSESSNLTAIYVICMIEALKNDRRISQECKQYPGWREFKRQWRCKRITDHPRPLSQPECGPIFIYKGGKKLQVTLASIRCCPLKADRFSGECAWQTHQSTLLGEMVRRQEIRLDNTDKYWTCTFYVPVLIFSILLAPTHLHVTKANSCSCSNIDVHLNEVKYYMNKCLVFSCNEVGRLVTGKTSDELNSQYREWPLHGTEWRFICAHSLN